MKSHLGQEGLLKVGDVVVVVGLGGVKIWRLEEEEHVDVVLGLCPVLEAIEVVCGLGVLVVPGVAK